MKPASAKAIFSFSHVSAYIVETLQVSRIRIILLYNLVTVYFLSSFFSQMGYRARIFQD